MQFGLLLNRASRAVYLLDNLKLHVREAKEEHWSQLYTIRHILLEIAKADERIDHRELMESLPDDVGEHGRWRHHMPDYFFETDRRDFVEGSP